MQDNFIFWIVAAIFLVLVGLISFFSIFGIYILNRYGKSKLTALSVSVVYAVVFLILLTTAISTLDKLRN